MKRMGAVESDSVKSARKAKGKLHKACERASETCERTLHGQEQNNAHAYGKHGSHETVIDFYKYNHGCREKLVMEWSCLSN